VLGACHPGLLGFAAVSNNFGSLEVAASKEAMPCALCSAAVATASKQQQLWGAVCMFSSVIVLM